MNHDHKEPDLSSGDGLSDKNIIDELVESKSVIKTLFLNSLIRLSDIKRTNISQQKTLTLYNDNEDSVYKDCCLSAKTTIEANKRTMIEIITSILWLIKHFGYFIPETEIKSFRMQYVNNK